MLMRSATHHVLVVTCSVFLLGSLCSPREVPMKSEQNAQSQEQATRKTIDSFNEAFNRHDADGLAKFLTEDTVFEDTSPAPDGKRIEGKAAVVEFWRGWFARNTDARFAAATPNDEHVQVRVYDSWHHDYHNWDDREDRGNLRQTQVLQVVLPDVCQPVYCMSEQHGFPWFGPHDIKWIPGYVS